LALASPASAAIVIDPSAPAGTFGNPTVTCTSGTTNCAFLDTITFLTPAGFNTLAATLISGPALTLGQDINFGPLGLQNGITINGQKFNLTGTGTGINSVENALLAAIPLVAGATNTLTVSGTVGTSGEGSYAGTLNFANITAAVPEAATWGMMVLGFGMIGFGLRRSPKLRKRVNFAMS